MGAAADRTDLQTNATGHPCPERADRPVEFLRAQLEFLRGMTGALEQFDPACEPTLIRKLYSVLCTDVGQLLQDRRANVLPVLRRRAAAEDEVDQLAATLEQAYRGVEADAEELARVLHAQLSAPAGARRLGDPAVRLALQLRQVVAVESAVLIPLLRVRLSDEDYDLLTAAFRARRERPPARPFGSA